MNIEKDPGQKVAILLRQIYTDALDVVHFVEYLDKYLTHFSRTLQL